MIALHNNSSHVIIAAYRDLDKLSSLNETEQSSYVVTKTDKKLLEAQQLYKALHRLENITSELKLCVAILGDKNASQRKWDHMARNITKVILPAIMKVTEILNDTGKDIARIDLVKVICDCNKKKKLLQTVDTTNEWKSTDIQMLGSYISLSRAISTIHHRDKRAHHEYNNVLLASLPIPANDISTQSLKHWQYC